MKKTSCVCGRLNIIKMEILPKTDLQIQCHPHQNASDVICRNRKMAKRKYHVEI